MGGRKERIMRLIDADALITWLSDWMFEKSPNPRMTEAERHDAEVMYEALEKAIRGIEKMPTIDAVPVVRCKDCKYFMKSERVDKRGWCSFSQHGCPMSDDYCSDAEGKEVTECVKHIWQSARSSSCMNLKYGSFVDFWEICVICGKKRIRWR